MSNSAQPITNEPSARPGQAVQHRGSSDPFARIAGHAAAAVCALLELIAAFGAIKRSMPAELVVTLLTVGALTVVLAVLSWTRQSRVAWSFLSVMSAVMAICILFGSAKLRDALGISFTVCMIFPLLFVFTTAMLALLGRDYREGSIAR
jgi:uncharacterized membrane protein YfcA